MKTLIVFLCLLPVKLFGQEFDYLTYETKLAEYIIVNSKTEAYRSAPFGKNISIEYDQVLKSYKIRYTFIDGEEKELLLRYVSTKYKTRNTKHGVIKLSDYLIYVDYNTSEEYHLKPALDEEFQLVRLDLYIPSLYEKKKDHTNLSLVRFDNLRLVSQSNQPTD